MGEPVRCVKCNRDVTAEVSWALSNAQFGGYNPMSIQYARPWSDDEVAQFNRSYVCQQCEEKGG